ncbi:MULTISPECIES: hypothetical protein [unclassified Halomonas]|uniref:hypothetical protein n=1 Tax=unclassified Halomonas TaxID=2609666 RepID=UPI0012DAD954|nr:MULTISPECIES: hypothetical protein [unclassified Halomonas]QGQ69824.1 hypothetical protein FDY98_06595 [Halomonas sp. PA16-9]
MRMIDPDFEWPLIEVPDPDYLGKDVAPVIKVRDESIDPPMINVPNPGCRLPNDVVEITAEEHSELLAGQAGGLRIIADESGYPVLASPPQNPSTNSPPTSSASWTLPAMKLLHLVWSTISTAKPM